VVGAQMPLVDSGFRRGTDIVKALAPGAEAVCIGQPYLEPRRIQSAGCRTHLETLRAETPAAMQAGDLPHP